MSAKPFHTKEFECHGTLTLSNHGGFELELSDDGEYARLKYYNDPPSKWQGLKDHYLHGRYVSFHGCIYYLKEFMRTNLTFGYNG